MQSSPSDDPPKASKHQFLSRSSVIKQWCHEAAFWRPKPWTLIQDDVCFQVSLSVCDVFPSKGWIGCISKGQEVIKSESLNFGQKDVDSWRWILMIWQKKDKKKNPYWTMIETIFCHCFIIYLIILKSNSNSSKHMTLHCMQIRFISNCVVFDLGAQIFKFRLTDHSLIGLL